MLQLLRRMSIHGDGRRVNVRFRGQPVPALESAEAEQLVQRAKDDLLLLAEQLTDLAERASLDVNPAHICHLAGLPPMPFLLRYFGTVATMDVPALSARNKRNEGVRYFCGLIWNFGSLDRQQLLSLLFDVYDLSKVGFLRMHELRHFLEDVLSFTEQSYEKVVGQVMQDMQTYVGVFISKSTSMTSLAESVTSLGSSKSLYQDLELERRLKIPKTIFMRFFTKLHLGKLWPVMMVRDKLRKTFNDPGYWEEIEAVRRQLPLADNEGFTLAIHVLVRLRVKWKNTSMGTKAFEALLKRSQSQQALSEKSEDDTASELDRQRAQRRATFFARVPISRTASESSLSQTNSSRRSLGSSLRALLPTLGVLRPTRSASARELRTSGGNREEIDVPSVPISPLASLDEAEDDDNASSVIGRCHSIEDIVLDENEYEGITLDMVLDDHQEFISPLPSPGPPRKYSF